MARTGQRRLAVMLLIAVIGPCFALVGCKKDGGRSPAAGSTQPAAEKPLQHEDEAYVAALAMANMFCQAWQTRDVGGGEILLSPGLKSRYSPEQLRKAIMGWSNPKHAAYEISAGHRLDDGRIAFDLRLFFRYTGRHADRIEAPLERIVMVRNAGGHWQVDEFPIRGSARKGASAP